MTGDMTVKEYAYFILAREGAISESTLRRKLLEVYKDSCVDCILREIMEDDRVLCISGDINDNLLILTSKEEEDDE